jgi:hypothetical protein
VRSRARDDGEAVSASDVVQYYVAACAEEELAGVGAALADKLIKLREYMLTACPAVCGEVRGPACI